MQRLVTALVLLALLWALLALAPPWVFYVVALVAISLCCWEAYDLLEAGGAVPFKWVGVAAAAALLWSFTGMAPVFDASLPFAAGIVATLILAMASRDDAKEMLTSTVHTLFPLLTVALLLGYLVRLRAVPDDVGPLLLMMLFASVTASDTAAYYVGKNLGKRRLAPRISPKKTWEGLIAGLVAGLGVAILARVAMWPELPWGHTLVLGLLLPGAGVVGDLAESVFKRAAGVKDSSRLLPGHGGILDRTDSLLISAPTLYYYHQYLLQGSF